MPLPVPAMRTWNTNDLGTAALLNSNLRDGINFLLNVPLFQGTQANAQSLPGSIATTTPISLDTNLIDTYSGHSTVTNNSRYVAQVAGVYLVCGSCSVGSGCGAYIGTFLKNGNVIAGTQVTGTSPGITASIAPATALVTLAVGDYVQMGINVTNAVSTATPNLTGMNVIWLHA